MHLLEAPKGPPETAGQRLRAALTELGPTFVKLGQILSTRPDVMGNQVCQALSQLQDHVTALPFEQIAPVLEEELGGAADDLFAQFEPEAIAAASLSQVYRAVLKTGEPVAVKIQRPGARRVIDSDLRLIRLIADWVSEHVEESAWFDPVGVVIEFARSIERELDFEVEARVIERFRTNFADTPEVFVPLAYRDLSAKRVLTMDWVDGVRLDALEHYADRQCDPKVIAAIGCQSVCRQVFEFRLFHADPHPGNILITRNNQIAFLDYGMAGHLEGTDAAVLADLLYAVFRENAEACVDALLMLTTGEPESRQALEHEVASYIAFEAQAIVGGGRVGDGIERMVEILRHSHLQLAPRFSLLLKALATIESVAHQLDPHMDMLPIIQPYIKRLVTTRYSPLRLLGEAQEGIASLIKLGRRLPGDLDHLLRMLRRGRLKFQHKHDGLDHLTATVDRASNRIAFGVITGSLIVGSSLLIRAGTGASRVGLALFIIAGVLGVALLISILRSRNY
ncbi:MAG: hypothetical protein GWP08_01695 [Nitrospiraceae bacterium]|nr:hypothetical protein [Nitrospiraceae bacterium]